MASLQELRNKAKELNIPAAQIRKASSPAALQSLIMDVIMNGGGAPAATPARKTKTTPTRKATTPTRKAPAKTPAKKTARTDSPAKKAAAVKKVAATNGDAGRHVLRGIDYSVTDNWNARPGSIPDLIIKSLKKYRGDREKVFNALVDDIWSYVGRKMADGSKRTMASAEDMLRYRISRTAWDFAMKTGQHEAATNRAEYGQGTRPKAKAPAKKAPARRTPAKAKATPTPTRKRATAQKPVQRRTRRATSRVTKPVAKKKARR